MIMLVFAALLSASKSEVPPDQWSCANDIEVWCTVDSCDAKARDETTPMSITARINAAGEGDVTVCAYTGCWEGPAAVARNKGRISWAANALPFSTQPDGGFEADVTLLIIEKDGVGFVRAGGIASPLLCQHTPVAE